MREEVSGPAGGQQKIKASLSCSGRLILNQPFPMRGQGDEIGWESSLETLGCRIFNGRFSGLSLLTLFHGLVWACHLSFNGIKACSLPGWDDQLLQEVSPVSKAVAGRFR